MQISRKVFLLRLGRNFLFGIVIIACSLTIGVLGYHYFENMSWVDAFVNASMILSGMGPLGTLQTTAGKIFAGIYALFSGIMFIVVIGVVFAPVIHWFFQRFHMVDKDGEEK
jgi:hypothetical protein